MTVEYRMSQTAGQQHAEGVRNCNDSSMQNVSGSAITGACRMSQTVQLHGHTELLRQCNDNCMLNELGTEMTRAERMSQDVQIHGNAE